MCRPQIKKLASMRLGRESAILVLLCVLTSLCWLPRLHGPIDLRYDAGVYYILGSSLAQGKGYRLLNEPGEIKGTQYPPLLPAIVALHQLLVGTDNPFIVGRWLRITFFIIFVTYVLAIYVMLRLYLPLRYALLGSLLCLLHMWTQFLSDLLFSEILYGLMTTLFFLFHTYSRKRVNLVLSIILAIASYALRTVGITLLAAWVMESLLNRRLRQTFFRLALSLIPVICWQAYVYSVENSPEYNAPAYKYQRADYMFYNVSYARNMSLQDPFVPEKGYVTPISIARRFIHNSLRIPASVGEMLSARQDLWKGDLLPFLPYTLLGRRTIYFVLVTLGGLVFGGVVLQLIKRMWIIPLYILLYISIMCLTPGSPQFMRYLVPLAPFLVLALMNALLSLKEWSSSRLTGRWKACGMALAVLVVSLIMIQESLALASLYMNHHTWAGYEDPAGNRVQHRLFFYFDSDRGFDEGLDWLKREARPGDVVAASMPHWVYLRTGLKAVMPPLESEPDKAQSQLDSVPVRYIILQGHNPNNTKDYLLPLIRTSAGPWKKIYSARGGEMEIYERGAQP